MRAVPDYMKTGDHWATFYYAYCDWSKGVIACSGVEEQLFRILRRMRVQGLMRHLDNVDAQYIICQAWHEIQREKCIQEIWNA